MNCNELQDALMESDSAASDVMPAGMREHLASCARCSELRERLIRLENVVAEMGVVNGAGEARETFERMIRSRGASGGDAHRGGLEGQGDAGRVGSRVAGRVGGRLMRARWVWAAAALLAVALGTAGILLRGKGGGAVVKTQENNLIEQLVTWNVEMGAAPTPADRAKLYAARADAFKQRVRNANLGPGETRLVAELMDEGKWLSENQDPVAEAERFSQTVEHLADEMDSAVAAGKPDKVNALSRSYMLVMDKGLDHSLEQIRLRGLLDPQRQRRIAGVIQRNAMAAQRLERLLERFPNASNKQIRMMLERIRMRRQMMMQQRGAGSK